MPNPIGNMVIKVDLDGSGFNRGVTGLNRQMKMVSRELSANLSQFSRYDNSLEKSKIKVEGLSKKQKVQAQITKELKDSYDKLSKETGENSAKTQAAAAKYNEAYAKLNQYERELNQATQELKDMQREQKALNTAMGKLGTNFNNFGPKLQEIGNSMKNVGRNMTMYVTAPVVAGFAVAAKKGIEFDDSMRKVKATSGATGEEFEALKKKAREMGATTKFSASDSAEALNYMALAGWDSKQMMEGLSGVMDLAAASGEELGAVSDIVTDGLTAFGLKAKDSGHFADILAQTSSKANTDVRGLGEAFKYVAPVAGALGYTIEDTSIAIGLMSNAGIKGEKAGTALRTMFTNLSSPTRAMGNEMERLGISITDSNGKMIPMRKLLDQLREKFKHLSKDQQASSAATIFGKEAMSGALAIINASDEDYQKLTKSIDSSTGASKRMADTMESGLGGKLRTLRSQLEELALTIYDRIEPALKIIVSAFSKVVTWVTKLPTSIQLAVVGFGLFAAVLGPLVFMFGLFISVMGNAMTVLGPLLINVNKAGGLFALLRTKIASLVKLFPILGVSISSLTLPITLIVGALVGIGIAFYQAYKRSETFRNIVNQAISGVANAFKAAKLALQGFFDLFKGDSKGAVTLEKIFPPETATIGRLVDTQALFLEYRKKLQDVYTDVEDVKIAISDRFKLLQSQYTDEKYKEALEIIATKFGLTVNEDLQLVGEPNVVKSAIEAARESTKEQLRDYVKTSDYKTDKDGIVERLDTAEAERTTLKGEIKDKVTLNEYRNGLEEQKQYTDDQLSDLSNNPEIKASIEQANQEAQEALKSYIDAQDDLKEKESQAYADGKISEEEQRAIQDAQAKLEEAKQNAELKARNAEKKANAYTDNKVKESTDAQRKTLTRYGSQIIQNGKEIKLRTTKEEFNATNRTLSNILNEIVQNVTDGTTIRYDDNGVAQALNVGPRGIRLNADKIDINGNREINLLIQNMRDKVDKTDIVNSLNLSREGLDINVNRIGIKGGDNNRYVQIQNDSIELGGIVQRTWRGKRSTDDIFTRLKDGHLRFRNNTAGGSLYMSHFGISTYIDGEGEDGGSSGTIQWWDKTYSDSGMNGITINSYGGVVALTSDNNRVVLESYASSNIKSKQAPVYLYPNTDKVPGLNRFAFTLSNADNAYSSDGYIMFGSDENYDYGAGIRFSKERNKGLVQIVNGRYATGGDTTIEAGYGKFNMLKRRDGNRYIHIQSTDLLSVGSDDAGDRIASNSIYRRTYSSAANLHITSAGTIGRSTSARKYKLSIENQYNDRDEQLEHSKAILNLPIRTWFDKAESEILARELREDRKLSEDTYKLDRYVGLIAEEVENLGLKEFVTYDDKGEIEGIAYDRLWIHLIPVIKEQQLRIKKLEESKNEG
ncbi:phage tail tape measure protein [Staphylococcus aureus]